MNWWKYQDNVDEAYTGGSIKALIVIQWMRNGLVEVSRQCG